MTDEPQGAQSPADEQRTTALPRRPAPGGGSGTPQGAGGHRPQGGPAPPGVPTDDDATHETTVLRRPAGPSPSGPSNLPGAVRHGPAPVWRPQPPPTGAAPGDRAAPVPRDDPWTGGYGRRSGTPPAGYSDARGPVAPGGYRPPIGAPADEDRRGDRDRGHRPSRPADDPRARRGARPDEDHHAPWDTGAARPDDRDRRPYGADPYPADRYDRARPDGAYDRDDDTHDRDDRAHRRYTRRYGRDDDTHDRDYRDDARGERGDHRDYWYDDAGYRGASGRGSAPDGYPAGPRSRDPRAAGDRQHPAGPSTSRYHSDLPPYTEPPELAGEAAESPEFPEFPEPATPRGLNRTPRKLTVTRVAALRSRQLTHRGMELFHGAVTADGADRSGLGHLTYAVMANYAVDAALAVALANTLFFAAAKADSTGKVLLYLLLTVAPFAVIAPFIGPLLDRVQNGRRIALSLSSFGRAVLAVIMAVKFDSWVIYPCALGMLVLSKSFGVLKAALTPRVLPDAITLVKTNSRLTVFGMIAGGASGAVAAGIAAVTSSAGALGFTAACAVVGGWLCLRIPAWVESTEGEVPVERRTSAGADAAAGPGAHRRRHRVLPRPVAAALWTNATIRVETGFLALFIAFVVKSRYQPSSVVATPGVTATPPTDNEGFMQLLLLGAIGAAAGVGGFVGNALGARLPLRAPVTVALACLGTVIASVLLAFLMPGLVTAGVVAFVGSTASSLAKVCLDSTIQHHLPEVSRASAFGRSESVLQLTWVFGGVLGLLIGGVWALHGDAVYLVGFGVVGALLLAGGAQCLALRMGRSLLPAINLRMLLHRRPRHDTTPVPRAGGATPYPVAGTAGPAGAADPSRASGGPGRAGSQVAGRPARRATRKAGRPR